MKEWAMANDLDFDDTFGDEDIELDEQPRRRSPLRIILLLLVVLVLLCVVCVLGSRLLSGTLSSIIPVDSLPAPIQNILPMAVETPTLPPAIDTSTPELVATEELPPPETSEPAPTEELPTPETGELPVTTEPTEELIQPTTEPTEEPTEEVIEVTVEVTIEVTPTATTAPVPGPTSTPTPLSEPTLEAGPTVTVTVTGCENNIPPTAEANGPYTAMMGKGQAFVTFDATGSSDPDGTIIKYEWDFGDGSEPGSGETIIHGYTSIDAYVIVLTITDNCNATSQDTAEVTIVGPTPPASNGDNQSTPAPSPTNSPSSSQTTLGFCYLVQHGDTLSGIAWYYGISLQNLATVNGVSTDYLVVAGEGLFIPSDKIISGPNAYLAQAGDTFNSIAYQCGLTTTALAEANGLDPNTELSPGQIIIIPLGR
jgi:LysM repeat protein